MSDTHKYPVGYKFMADGFGQCEVIALRNTCDRHLGPQYKVREADNGVCYMHEKEIDYCTPIVTSDNESNPQIARFKAIADEMVKTYEAKNHDYGNAYEAGYRLFGHVQLLSRIYEKFMRVHNLLNGEQRKVDDETIGQTLTDMANQCICLRMILETDEFENVK